MIEIQVTQTVRVACDHCGKRAGDDDCWWDTVVDARKCAEAERFVFTRWREGDCPRELTLCHECYAVTSR